MIPHAGKHDRLPALGIGLEESDFKYFRAHRLKLRLNILDSACTTGCH